MILDIKIRFTGAGEADDGGRRGLGVDEDELESGGGAAAGEEMLQGPVEGVFAVLTVVDPHHHHRFRLRLIHCHFFDLLFDTESERKLGELLKRGEDDV